jgi:predicted metal-dependent hydrolase
VEAARQPFMPAYTIRRSTRARRSRLTITDEGHAVVVLPARAPERDAAELVARHRAWVDTHSRKQRERHAALAARPQLGRGREILHSGTLHRVVSIASIDGRTRTSVRVANDCIVLTSAPLDSRPVADSLEAWFRADARRVISARVAERSQEMSIVPARVAIRDQRTRWGSASRRGTLSFSWRLMMCPPDVLDYVVVHELAHLKVAGHGKAFWRLVDRHFADSRGARRWLREHHDEIRHALD